MGNACAGHPQNQAATFRYRKDMFTLVKVIGKGGFGKVWKVIEKNTKNTYALKIISKAKVISKKSVQSILNEKQILTLLRQDQSEFIINMKGAFQDQQNCYLLMEYLQGGDLRHYINKKIKFHENQVKFIIRCLIKGINYLHQKKIIHRDIKPQNIIFDSQGYARITDFGISRYQNPQNQHQASGTLSYMAPEVLLRQNHSYPVDFYALGVIAYELLVGRRPYEGRDRKTITQQMLSKQVKLTTEKYPHLSEQGVDFINKLLNRTAKKRLGYNGISEIDKHRWLHLKFEDRMQFLQKKTKSPIIPIEINFSQMYQQQTQLNDVEKQNSQLLKNKYFQQIFFNYEFFTNLDYQKTKRHKKTNSCYPNIII